MPRVLIVAYHWLPDATPDARALALLCRHLPGAGWEPHLLAREAAADTCEPDVPQLSAVDFAVSVALRAARQFPVLRVPLVAAEGKLRRWRGALRLAREGGDAGRTRPMLRAVGRTVLDATYPLYGAYPDAQRDWVEPAVETGMAAVRRYGISAVVSVGPPASAHIAGGRIAREASIPWVVLANDLSGLFADAATQGPAMHAMLARRWLRGASRAGAPTPAAVAYLRERHGLEGEVIVAPYDPEDRRVPPRRTVGAPLRVSHVGALAAGSREAGILFDALDLLLAEEPSRRERIVVELVGSGDADAVRDRLGTRPAASVIALREGAGIADELRTRREADVLLQLEQDDRGAPGVPSLRHAPRLFEQMHARRPIVAIVERSDGFVARTLAGSGAGVTVTDATGLAALLRDMLAELAELAVQSGLTFMDEETSTAPYSSPEQAKRLALLLDAASAERFGRWQRA